MSDREFLELAGMQMIIHPPANPELPAPLILLWHGFGTPNTSEQLSQTLPLEAVQAWKAYLELPLIGQLLRAGNLEELMHRQIEDYVLQLLLPSIEPALRSLPEVVEALQSRFNVDRQAGIGLFGFSAGGLAALLTLVESSVPITAAVLAGVTKDLSAAVDTYERAMQQYYPILKEQFPWIETQQLRYSWTGASEAAKQRLNFVARASDIAQRKPLPAILFVHAVQDEAYALKDVETLYEALYSVYEPVQQQARLSLKTFEHLKHHLDLAAAQNSPDLQWDLTQLQQEVAAWFSQYLN